MSVSFSLPHPVAASGFIICSGLCACTEMLGMCVPYVCFGSKVRPIIFGASPWVVQCCLFKVHIALILCRIWREQSFLSGPSVRLFCFVQAKKVYVVWLYVFLGCTRACVCRCDGDVICVGRELNR